MALVPMRLLLDHAAENNYGIPAFNVNNMEQIQAIMQAAHETDSPVILQASRGARKYAGENFLRHLILAAVETYPHLPIAMHQDHGNEPATCYSAIKNGFTSVMMDGSLEADAKTPASYEYNVNVTREVVKVAHALGVSVEGELGCLGSLETGMGDKEDGHGFEGKLSHDQLLTDPDQAVDFVEQTQVDALAVAIGTSHGAYKFTRKPTGEILAISRIEEIHRRLPNTHLVMHGSSSVPEDLIALINQYGGTIPETYGVPVEEIQKGIKSGVRKVNIDTDNRLAITAAVREALAKDPKEFDPRHFLKPSIKYMQKVCAERYQQFETAGNASKIKQVSLDEFAAKYAKGELSAAIKKTVAL
ncbi:MULTISPECIES: class II fructose-bisphosphate aldolase [Fischerella]|jgi:fructose-bisphosphate aldolase class II|uniref:Fructose-1,6-bisphosphate aldolase n=3 Tax=Fischerella TaxID=1190 RepID=G6FS04_9CYAN|nr:MULTISPECIES: class II fructose-bisphosphate aldolase [Fischerella]PMB02168.1 fructose-bisphosphate aldolase class II [Fischerella thermalis CCMEE 5328]PMB08523.1 fructose-bisphosphate aldolase class II [Fischerella thermalis CCMEE 5273]PMB47019.1 fructose-bisphosphate aldolase class II [Fischerella thermalis CCMEE 5201]BCX10312.1 MAG: fructose-1,6-bisphosphate aldolase [Fischerella sp.]EHC16228.1 fructose-bisphosphate aldolase, class II, Calvin cycle subtype [Fischerella thermalis JSC-11]